MRQICRGRKARRNCAQKRDPPHDKSGLVPWERNLMKRRSKKEAGERKEGWFSTPSAPLSSSIHTFASPCSWTRFIEKDQSKSAGSVTLPQAGFAPRAPGLVDPNRVEKEIGIPDETRGCVGGARARSIAPGESVVSACRALFGRGESSRQWSRIHSESGKLVLILDE